MGQGPAFRCRDPDGHIVELYYETEWYQPPPELKPALKNQAQRFPARGVNVRRLDHLNCLAVDIKANRLFFENYLYSASPLNFSYRALFANNLLFYRTDEMIANPPTRLDETRLSGLIIESFTDCADALAQRVIVNVFSLPETVE